MISNWKHFKWPYEPMDRFTRHTPVNDEVKATYIDGRRKPRKGDRKTGADILKVLRR